MANLPIAATYALNDASGVVVSCGVIKTGFIKGKRRYAVNVLAGGRPVVFCTLEEAKNHVKAWASFNISRGWGWPLRRLKIA